MQHTANVRRPHYGQNARMQIRSLVEHIRYPLQHGETGPSLQPRLKVRMAFATLNNWWAETRNPALDLPEANRALQNLLNPLKSCHFDLLSQPRGYIAPRWLTVGCMRLLGGYVGYNLYHLELNWFISIRSQIRLGIPILLQKSLITRVLR